MDPSILIGLFVASVLIFFACQINVGADPATADSHGHGDDGHGHGDDHGHGATDDHGPAAPEHDH